MDETLFGMLLWEWRAWEWYNELNEEAYWENSWYFAVCGEFGVG